MVIQANIGSSGGGGGSYLTTNGATTGATSQAQVFTNGIKTPIIDDNATSEIAFTISTVQKASINATGIWVTNGSATTPSYYFQSDSTTGFYLKTALSEIGASVNGALVGGFKTTGLFATLTAYANNAAALAGGLVAGDFYRITSGGTSTVAVVQ